MVWLLVIGVVATGLSLLSPGGACAGNIADFTLIIKTTDDNREGGIIEVNLWQGNRPIAKYEDMGKSWEVGKDPDKINADNPIKARAFKKAVPIEARIKLRDGKEYNIRWAFNIEVIAFDDKGDELVFKRDGMVLDTTGKGPNLEDEKTIATVMP
jgi:hypothetical protein